MAEGGVCSSILIPVGERGQTLGYISLVWTRSIGQWSPADVREASTTASLVAQLLVRSRAEERYGTAFNASPLGIALFGSRAELLEANPAFLDMHGATLEQMRAADLHDELLLGRDPVRTVSVESGRYEEKGHDRNPPVRRPNPMREPQHGSSSLRFPSQVQRATGSIRYPESKCPEGRRT